MVQKDIPAHQHMLSRLHGRACPAHLCRLISWYGCLFMSVCGSTTHDACRWHCSIAFNLLPPLDLLQCLRIVCRCAAGRHDLVSMRLWYSDNGLAANAVTAIVTHLGHQSTRLVFTNTDLCCCCARISQCQSAAAALPPDAVWRGVQHLRLCILPHAGALLHAAAATVLHGNRRPLRCVTARHWLAAAA